MNTIKRTRTHSNPLANLQEYAFEGFGNNKPIFVDVGAFKGEFMAELADKYPDHNYICFEIRLPIAEHLREKFKDRPNFRVFDGDAGRNFQNILEPCIKEGASIEQIFVNFPDPWFKDRHKKRRFITTNFCNTLATWLPAETEIVFQTDQQFLFEETLEYLEETPYQSIKRFEGSVHGIPTDWEKVKMAKGETIWRMSFTR
jgi:tRNA (guanine-N7-)-methyltransferase